MPQEYIPAPRPWQNPTSQETLPGTDSTTTVTDTVRQAKLGVSYTVKVRVESPQKAEAR